ncbi:soluble lytic murein transglycosylase [Desulfonispora thiosulfatigenes DSM 11270]|uniref:Soluble lytic murein transglycosylase n=1 Tax=Desulfonispora thiosulfatigenes DSM 11270 TaxID=656914 RepID=A0A1W1VHY3_DESTI|nr:lytic transglycosylase domain-containing protein [Desulfonispora thiosulfatigenes]SMB92936.1 soluble lytic murein transglycosylase [Desulfonispora thiosulfatigenes DSM 11270]
MILRIRTLMKIMVVLFLLVFMGLILLNSSWFLKLFYPKPYEDIVSAESIKHDVDENLIYAIVKAESKFNKTVVSPRGARGLMQIMPETGAWIAEELTLEGYSQDKLFEPYSNLKMGIWYYSYLVQQFKGNNITAIAAYNGGETNVNKWIKQNIWSGQESDVQNIPFKETREYVIKVLMNYKMYQNLYTDQTI